MHAYIFIYFPCASVTHYWHSLIPVGMAKLKLYYDLMSQPSRAVYIFLKVNNIPFEAIQIAIRNGRYILFHSYLLFGYVTRFILRLCNPNTYPITIQRLT